MHYYYISVYQISDTFLQQCTLISIKHIVKKPISEKIEKEENDIAYHKKMIVPREIAIIHLFLSKILESFLEKYNYSSYSQSHHLTGLILFEADMHCPTLQNVTFCELPDVSVSNSLLELGTALVS